MIRGLRLVLLVLVALGSLALPATARANEVDDRIARADKLQIDRTKLDADRHALDKTYQDKTAQVTSLKATPPSWSRDRKLQALLAESKDMASTLDQDDERLHVLDSAIAAEDQALLAAIAVELATSPSPERTVVLTHKRAEIAARQAATRRLKIADESITPTDDALDLDYKAGALAESEAQLAAEEQALGDRATHYHKLALLTQSRARADQHDVFRDEDPRLGDHHTSGASAGPSTPAGSVNGPPPSNTIGGTAPGTTGTPTQGGGTPTATGGSHDTPSVGTAVDPSVVLADVVGSTTLDELRRAELSGDPEALARAAERAQKDLAARAARVRDRRLEMERRAREMRGSP